MTDAYTRFVRSGPGALIAKRTGLPRPPRLLRRADRPEPVLGPVVVLGRSAGADRIAEHYLQAGCDVRRRFDELRKVGTVIAVLDEISSPAEIQDILLPLAPAMRSLLPGSRIVTISRPATGEDLARDAARGGIEGFVRSLGHEVRGGGTANGIQVADGVELTAPSVLGALRFLLSARSAFIDGQFLVVSSADGETVADPATAYDGQNVLVTGAARGIGAAIARTFAAAGAHTVLLDVPAAGTELARLANELHGVPIQLDVTADNAPERLISFLAEKGITLDAIVLNAGITRDRMFANMTEDKWAPVIAVNITSQIRLVEGLLAAKDALGPAPRVVSLASTSGVAGNRGQTNYATSKAGVIAFVDALAAQLEGAGGTANAVAPGFIETEMTAKIPPVNREVARRVNSLKQGGLPLDVAEAIAFLASREAIGIRGETLRVCGQNIVGR